MLLDRAHFAALANRPDVANAAGAYPDAYLLPLLQSVEDEIGAYLHYAPALQVHTAEQGPVLFMESGAYAGRYEIELQHRPLPPGPVTVAFTEVQLTYALAFTAPSDVLLTYLTVDHGTGRVYALAPGLSDALVGAGFGFQYGPSLAPGYATGYTATYVAGYTTGIADPTPDGTTATSYHAPLLPEDIRAAAVSLARERLMFDQAFNAQTDNPFAGFLVRRKSADQEEQYQQVGRKGGIAPVLGYGSPLAQAAQNRLDKLVRTTVVTLL